MMGGLPRSIGIIVPAGVMSCECQWKQEESEMDATTAVVDLAKNLCQMTRADRQFRVIGTWGLTRSRFQRCFQNRHVTLS